MIKVCRLLEEAIWPNWRFFSFAQFYFKPFLLMSPILREHFGSRIHVPGVFTNDGILSGLLVYLFVILIANMSLKCRIKFCVLAAMLLKTPVLDKFLFNLLGPFSFIYLLGIYSFYLQDICIIFGHNYRPN